MRKLLVVVLFFAMGVGQSVLAEVIYDENFDANNGGYTVLNQGTPSGPWQWDSGSGTWRANGSDNRGIPSHSRLTSPAIAVDMDGPVELSFDHRYSFEAEYDGGAVFVSVNGGAFNQEVANDAFSENGYTYFGLIGNHDLNGLDGFNGDSPGYDSGSFITSTASLGTFSAGDTLMVRFLAAWDEFTKGQEPNWQITSVTLSQVPEPSTLLLAVFGGFGLIALVRRRRRK